jgi:tetratricopeptide (TPR) repeat protein
MPERPRLELAAAALLLGLALASTLASAATLPESQLQRVLRKHQRLLAAEPGNATLWNDLGNLLMLGGWTERAEEAYLQALEVDTSLVSARFNLALLYQQTKRPGRSKRALKKILKSNPEHAWSHYYLGVANAETGHRKAAVASYARALRLDRGLSDPRVNPHIVDNELAPLATLRAYADLKGAELAPRMYENRDRVVRAMIRRNQLEGNLSDSGGKRGRSKVNRASEAPDVDEPR